MGTNSDRNKRGNSLKRVVEYLLQLCKELDYIKTYKKNYSLGKAGYSDKHQFKAPYRIEFSDGSEWIIFTTTSQRDRIKEQYWDAFNLKSLNNHITNAYLVYPDGLETKKKEEFIRKNEKIQNTTSRRRTNPINSDNTASAAPSGRRYKPITKND